MSTTFVNDLILRVTGAQQAIINHKKMRFRQELSNNTVFENLNQELQIAREQYEEKLRKTPNVGNNTAKNACERLNRDLQNASDASRLISFMNNAKTFFESQI